MVQLNVHMWPVAIRKYAEARVYCKILHVCMIIIARIYLESKA